jgi:hypothetical protein
MNEYQLPFAIIREVVMGKVKLLLSLVVVGGIIPFFVLREVSVRPRPHHLLGASMGLS